MKLKCKRCKKEWEYKGKKKLNKKFPQYINCPRCRYNVKMEVEK